jgi:hypothetical protein
MKAPGGRFLAAAGIALIMFGAPSCRPLDPPQPPGPLLGCYSTPGGPDLQFDRSSLTIQQEPPAKFKSSLKFIKGWAFEIDTWLNFHQTPGGRIILEPGWPNGEFLQLSREGEFASQVPSFELYDRNTLRSVRYSRVGDACSSPR